MKILFLKLKLWWFDKLLEKHACYTRRLEKLANWFGGERATKIRLYQKKYIKKHNDPLLKEIMYIRTQLKINPGVKGVWWG